MGMLSLGANFLKQFKGDNMFCLIKLSWNLLLFKMIFYFLPSSDYGQSPCEDYIRCVY